MKFNEIRDCGCSPSRRDFVKALGAVAVTGSVGSMASCASIAANAPRRLVDTHFHFFPESYEKAWIEWQQKNKVPVSVQPGWTPKRALEVMDKGGVATSLLSLASTPGTWFDQGAAAADRWARLCNDFGANMVRDFPGRFGLLATLPMLTIDTTMKELEYAFDTLKADGVGLQTNYGARYPGDNFYRPVWEELNRRKALVYFHPLGAQCCIPSGVPGTSGPIETPTDTTRAVLSLLNSGTFARYRDIKWLFSHGGGSVPMLAGRIIAFGERSKGVNTYAPNGIQYELARLHYDTANATHPAAMAALNTLVAETQITYGSDYPYFPIHEQVESLRALGYGSSKLYAIERGNAERLVPWLATGRKA
ncbi:MAG: amidohydrolase family protein [Burkholderiales bacterium]